MKIRNIFSAITISLLFLSMVYTRLITPFHNHFSWDVYGYYIYLPSTFIYHDVGLKDMKLVDSLNKKYQNTPYYYQLVPKPHGKHITRYPVGMAILYSPWFFTGHAIAKISSWPADGYSMPYQLAVSYGLFIYTFLALLLLRKILLRYLNDVITTLTLMILVLGTNYFLIASLDGLMPHAPLFFIYTLIIELSIQWHENHRKWISFWLGLSMGLAIISRQSEIVCVLIPLLWGVKSWKELRDRWGLLKEKKSLIFLVALGMFSIAAIQMMYWQIAGSQAILYSYGNNPGEGFELLWPYTLKFLFSFRKGWLIYTPLMVFAIIGFYHLWKNKREVFVPLFVFFVVNLYLVSSWSCWYYAASFSSRAMVQSLPVMAVPLGFFIKWLSESRLWTKLSLSVIIIFFVVLNLFQTWQYHHEIIDHYRMTKAYYWKIFGKTHVNEEDKMLLLVNRGADATPGDINQYKVSTIYKNDFETVFPYYDNLRTNEISRSGLFSLKPDTSFSNIDLKEVKIKDLMQTYYAWIRISLWVYPTQDSIKGELNIIAQLTHKGKGYYDKSLNICSKNLVPRKWNYIEFDYLTPEYRRKSNTLKVFLENKGVNKVFIDDLTIQVLEPKAELK